MTCVLFLFSVYLMNVVVVGQTPSARPSSKPTAIPSSKPTAFPSLTPSSKPTTSRPSPFPSLFPSSKPSAIPSARPSSKPSPVPSPRPSAEPSVRPSSKPSAVPSTKPTAVPSSKPTTSTPSSVPSYANTPFISYSPSFAPFALTYPGFKLNTETSWGSFPRESSNGFVELVPSIDDSDITPNIRFVFKTLLFGGEYSCSKLSSPVAYTSSTSTFFGICVYDVNEKSRWLADFELLFMDSTVSNPISTSYFFGGNGVGAEYGNTRFQEWSGNTDTGTGRYQTYTPHLSRYFTEITTSPLLLNFDTVCVFNSCGSEDSKGTGYYCSDYAQFNGSFFLKDFSTTSSVNTTVNSQNEFCMPKDVPYVETNSPTSKPTSKPSASPTPRPSSPSAGPTASPSARPTASLK